ncbi:MAG: MATE family efflux transporter, partial [Lachnospiraceae bacterium]|nr:MATE family efflux transporter [Lachnospiraceae bacterium]
IMIAPIIVSEFLWSLGQNVNSAVYGRIGTDSLAAYTLTAPIQGLFCGALSGLSAAAGIIIGKELGKKDYDQAYGDSKKLLKLGLVGALLLSVILILLSPVYASLYNVAQEVRDVTRLLLIVFAAYAPVKVLNMILGGGIIKSGGDTKTVMLIDTFGTWGVGIPLCLFAAYVLHLSIVPVYAILSVEEVVRLGISMVVFARKSWMKSLDTEG